MFLSFALDLIFCFIFGFLSISFKQLILSNKNARNFCGPRNKQPTKQPRLSIQSSSQPTNHLAIHLSSHPAIYSNTHALSMKNYVKINTKRQRQRQRFNQLVFWVLQKKNKKKNKS